MRHHREENNRINGGISLKSNPYKNKKYRFDRIDKESKRTTRIRRSLGWSVGSFAKKFPLRRKHRQPGGLIQSKEVYIDSSRRNGHPAWLIPLLLILGISLVAFWVGPLVLNTISKTFFKQVEKNPTANLQYNTADYATVKKQVADLFKTPDLKSERETQLLYNQLVHIIDRSTYGFYQVELEDGTKGYVMSEDVTSYTGSVEPALYDYRIIVISTSKRIMTHSSNGSTIMEAMMGTVLYSNYQGDGVYKVALPDKTEGWISANGVLKIKIGEEILKSNAKSFYTTVQSFNNTTYIEKGMTQNGASSEGIAYIAAKINGVTLPRGKEAQSKVGEEVPLKYDEETGLLLFDDLKEGDLIFFKDAEDQAKVGEMGIIVGYGKVLMSRNSKASVKIVDMAGTSTLRETVLAVRRIF